jgi:hypothetical protein
MTAGSRQLAVGSIWRIASRGRKPTVTADRQLPTATADCRLPRASGQAAIEFVAGLLLLLLVITGMIHVANMGRASLYLHAALRGEAGEGAMRDGSIGTSPPYISDWSPGEDGLRHTADDQPVRGLASATTGDLAAYSVRSPGDWTYAADSRLPVSMLRLSESPGAMLAFTHEEDTIRVALSRVIQQLVYNKKEVAIKEEVWMPLMGGLY